MIKRNSLVAIAGSALLVAALPLAAAAQDEKKEFHWVSHGNPADPVWTLFLEGAEQWAADTGNTVVTSFHVNQVAPQQEAVRAAIAAGADGIATTSPDPGSMLELAQEANEAGIPIINFNTPDPEVSWNGYVGTDNRSVGAQWAQYLVDNGHIEAGDHVWMPVEVPGATYQVHETEGIASVLDPLGITYEVHDATYEPATVIDAMVAYLTANSDDIDAMIGLGDLVTGSVARVWDQVGITAGDIPVVGWGNSPETAQAILDGYVLAGMWQDPQLTSYLALAEANATSSGLRPHAYLQMGTMYEADLAQEFLEAMGG